MDLQEHTPLLSASPRSSRSLQRVGVAALLALSLSTAFALVRVSLLATELQAALQQQTPVVLSQRAPQAFASTSRGTATVNDTRVLIVYSSGAHLARMAQAVERGVRQVVASPETLLRSRTVENASFADDVMWADAVILGSHVINANVEPKMAAFLSTWVLSEDLSRKVGAAFVTGGGMSSGEELTMVNLLHSMMIFRMIIVGGERWTSAFGASAIVSEGPFQPLAHVRPHSRDFPSICYPTDPDQLHDLFREKAEGLGRRVASVSSLTRAHGV